MTQTRRTNAQRATDDYRVLAAIRATDPNLRTANDRRRLAGLERLSAARLRVAVRVAMGDE